MKSILLSIIIPVFNEEKTIERIISEVKSVRLPKNINKEIIIVDDCSSDNTPKILSKIKGTKVFTHHVNKGKGHAVRTGLAKATGDILLIQDADLEYDPKYIPALIMPILDGTAKVVYGTRLKNYPLRLVGKKRTPLIAHYVGNKLLSFATSLLFASKVTDMETGYKVFHRTALNGIKLRSTKFELEPEITAKVLKKGFAIYEIPIKTTPRGYDDGKKITWIDGLAAIKALIKYRFTD